MGVRDGDRVQLVAAEAEGATLACDRCGTFAELGWLWDKRLCEECRSRQHPMLSTPPKAFTLIVETVKLLPAIGVRGVLVALAPLPLTLAVRRVVPRVVSGNVRADTLADLVPSVSLAVVRGVASGVLICALLQVLLDGASADYARAWQRVRPCMTALLALAVLDAAVQQLATAWFTFGTLIWVPFVLAFPIVLHERAGVLAALRASFLRLRGHFLPLLGAGFFFALALTLLFIAVILPLNVALKMPRHGLPPLASATMEGSFELLLQPFTVLQTLLYVKLPPRAEVQP